MCNASLVGDVLRGNPLSLGYNTIACLGHSNCINVYVYKEFKVSTEGESNQDSRHWLDIDWSHC